MLLSPFRAAAYVYSNIELAYTPRVGNGIPLGCLWIERLLLHLDCRHCIPWQHLRPAHHALARDLIACACFDTLPHCCRPPK